MKKLMEKEAPKMAAHEKNAKMSVLEHLKKVAEGMMKDHVGGMKKVSVASNSSKGLAEGLDKAKQMASKGEEIEGDSLNDETPGELVHGDVEAQEQDRVPFSGEVADPMEEHPGEEESEMSEEEIDAKIQSLMALKKSKMPQ